MADSPASNIAPKDAENDLHRFPCTECGSQLDYQPGTLHMACKHCGNEHLITKVSDPILEYDYHQALSTLPQANLEDIKLALECDTCGANTQFDKNIHADECPFCGSQFVHKAKETRQIQPKSLLPFDIDAASAKQAYKQWLKKLWFAPNKLKKYARQDQDLHGIYVPYWTYDCTANTHYRGDRGDVYYVRERVRVKVNDRWTTQVQRVAKIRWTPAYGQVSNHFNDTLIYASNTLTSKVANELEPWDLENLKSYQPEFLSGFKSELYHTDIEQGFNDSKARIKPTILQSIRRNIGGDQQRITQLNSQYHHITFKHILLPYWLAGFRFRKKTYQFVINGRTGEVQGDRPWSIIKIGLAVSAAIIGIVLIIQFADFQSLNY